MDRLKKYQQIQQYFKERIQVGEFQQDSFLPSEHDICAQFQTTRGTVRKALDELIKEGYIQKEHGRGSRVIERSKSLGLLTVRGFSGATDYEVTTTISQKPQLMAWDAAIEFPLTEEEQQYPCVYFQRIRHIEGAPVVIEDNWYSSQALELVDAEKFVEGSFFKTLSQQYLIEIKGVEHELRAEVASQELADMLHMDEGSPILNIAVRFRTSKPGLNLYGRLICNTAKYPIRNSYYL
ncbi:MAG: GntR family transcriptional regulator [Bacteroidota bacterium]